MKIFKLEDYLSTVNPTPGAPYKPEILSHEQGAKSLGGLFGLLPPGTPGNYHFHRNRESILIVFSGEATEVVEGKEVPVRAGDVLFIPAGEKHMLVNNSSREVRFLEFFTHPPVKSDFIEVKWDPNKQI